MQTIAGHNRLHREQALDLPAGRLLALGRMIAHNVEALEGSAILLAIAWPEDAIRV